MDSSTLLPPPLVRFSSGVPVLDRITGGGVFRGGIYLITGQPGAGKTILSNQICFDHAAKGGQVVFVTLLAENHARMLAHLRGLSFFDPELVGDRINYISGYYGDDDNSLVKLREMIQQTIRQRRPTLLVVDGMATAASLAQSEVVLKDFVHRLHVYGEAGGCTTLLLSNAPADIIGSPIHTIVDGVINLTDKYVGSRTVREVEVRKLRGTGYLRGWHSYDITDAGIVIHPRTEAVLSGSRPGPDEQRTRAAFGVPQLDAMLHGGLLSASTAMVMGVPGVGKTVLGSHFLAAGAEVGEPGLYFGFSEVPHRLVEKAERLHIPFTRYIDEGLIELYWQPPVEGVMDALAEQLLDIVRRRGVKRLFIDGYSGFQTASDHPERLITFFMALTNELRALGVTVLLSVEMRDLIGPVVELPLIGVSALMDNIILMRYVELRSQLYRLLSLTKVRESSYETAIREFIIGDHGIEVAETFASAQAVLTGLGQVLPADAKAPPPTEPGAGLHD